MTQFKIKSGDYICCKKTLDYMFVFKKGEYFNVILVWEDTRFDNVGVCHMIKVGTRLKYALEFDHIYENFRPITNQELRKLKLNKLNGERI